MKKIKNLKNLKNLISPITAIIVAASFFAAIYTICSTIENIVKMLCESNAIKVFIT